MPASRIEIEPQNDGRSRGASAAKACFGVVLALCFLLVWLSLLPEATNVSGQPHPNFPAMLQGGDGPARHADLLELGWLFGTLQILLFAALIAIGGSKKERLRGMGTPLIAITGVYLAGWTLLMVSYRGFLEAPDWLWLGLPAPTAVMIYLLWPLPALYVVLYARGFNRWIMSEEDVQELRQLVARLRAEREVIAPAQREVTARGERETSERHD